jgi:predicted nucleic acid-binding protein
MSLIINFLFMLNFITHHKSSIIGVVSALLMYALSKGYISMEEAILTSNIMAVFGISINIALPRK